jgi:hypothetical protein
MEIKLPTTITAQYDEGGVWDPDTMDMTGVPTVTIKFGDAVIDYIKISKDRAGEFYDSERAVNDLVADWFRTRLAARTTP